jgi:trans-aconitate 2-methyltransferase
METGMSDWMPEQYLKFKDYRTQPSIDLVHRIAIDWQPDTLIDIGCGPGNSSHVLKCRWPGAYLLGIDNSENMIKRAGTDYPESEWIVADASTFTTEKKIDIVFSNATIQWIPDHPLLLKRLSSLLTSRGVLAFQIPLFDKMPLGKIIDSTSKNNRWGNVLSQCSSIFPCHDAHFYYDVLSEHFDTFDIWETDYIHVMGSHQDIIDWIKCTGMKPYLDSLDCDSLRNEFTQEILEQVTQVYPVAKNGTVLFPFKRLFLIGYRR